MRSDPPSLVEVRFPADVNLNSATSNDSAGKDVDERNPKQQQYGPAHESRLHTLI